MSSTTKLFSRKLNELLEILNSCESTEEAVQIVDNFDNRHQHLRMIKQEQFDSFDKQVQSAILKKMGLCWTSSVVLSELLEILNSCESTEEAVQIVDNFDDLYQYLRMMKQEQFDSFDRQVQLAILKKMRIRWASFVEIVVENPGIKKQEPTHLLKLIYRYSTKDYLTKESKVYMEKPFKTQLLWNRQLFLLFLCDCAESILHYFEERYPDDNRPRNTIQVARRYALGEATKKELSDAREEIEKAKERAHWYLANYAAQSVLYTVCPWWRCVYYIGYVYSSTHKRILFSPEDRLWEYLSGKFTVEDARKLYGSKTS
ncbi:MAG: hypothetical protein L3J07_03485 [Candidatus Magasanikbacteria bacterium]|nr:hypothetical protein [Candidatus Magasanikbacteria bacterium]